MEELYPNAAGLLLKLASFIKILSRQFTWDGSWIWQSCLMRSMSLEHVDDTVVSYADGHTHYIQSKENIETSSQGEHRDIKLTM